MKDAARRRAAPSVPTAAAAAETDARWLAVLLPLATALVLFATGDYRPFPSIDDFAYVPAAWAANDPALFPRDDLLAAVLVHAPAWRAVVPAMSATLGLPAAYWLATLLLTVATVWAAYRLMAALAPPARLFPLAALIGFAGHVVGLGRGAYDGALGAGFHVQWLALCLLLWAYAACVRGRPRLSGLWLGLAALAHPAVGAHGAFALAIGTLLPGGAGRWRRLAATAAVCLVVSAPVTLPLAYELAVAAGAPAAGDAAGIVEDGYLFRLPHQLDLSAMAPLLHWLVATTAAAGLAGAAALWRARAGAAVAAATGLFVGHLALLAAAMALYGAWGRMDWVAEVPALYMLSLTRTTPLLFVLAAVLLAAGLEAMLERLRRADAPRGWHELPVPLALVAAAVALVVLNVEPSPAALALAALAAVWAAGHRLPGLERAGGLAMAALAAVSVAAAGLPHRLEAAVPPAESELYRWVRAETPRHALFIVPPGMQGFRLHARRSVYVDFKVFPSAVPAAIARWRARLERVARPDAPALAAAGWQAVPYWDRSYAYANTPARIARLLRETGADYLVWSRAGLEVPPFLPVERPADGRVAAAFDNGEFVVYVRADERAN